MRSTTARSSRLLTTAVALTVALLPGASAYAQAAPGTSPPPASTALAQPTQIASLQTTIDWGGTVDLGVLGEAGQVVDLYARTGSAPFRVIRTATLSTGGTGSAGWSLRPQDTTTYYAQVRGGDRSEEYTVQVRRMATIHVSQANGVYTFSGFVQGAVPGTSVTLSRLDGRTGQVTTVASTTTDALGQYTVRIRLPEGLAGYYVQAARTAERSAVRSELYGLGVPATTAATISLGVAHSGDRYVFSGAVQPGRSVPVTLARVVDGRLVGIIGGRTNAKGSYSLSLRQAPGTRFYRVLTAPGSGITAATSRLYGLVVPER